MKFKPVVYLIIIAASASLYFYVHDQDLARIEISEEKAVEKKIIDPSMQIQTEYPSLPSSEKQAVIKNENVFAKDKDLDPDIEEKVSAILKDPKGKISEVMDVHSIVCWTKQCIIEAESKTDNIGSFHTTMINFLRDNPWMGDKFEIKPDEDNSRLAVFILSRSE